jgi:cytochrome c biogenesis protein CcmG/thiol:disulfide interchange protein DsbE
MYLYAELPEAKKMPGGYSKVYRKMPAPKSLNEFSPKGEGGITTPGLLSGMNTAVYIKSGKLKPSEKVGGVDTYVVTYPVKTGKKGVTRTETLWIGKNDFLLRQIKSSVQISPSAMGPMPKGAKKPKGPIVMTQKTVMESVKANEPISGKIYRFVPPKGAKDAATIKPPKQQMNLPPPPNVTGKKAPDFSIMSTSGKKVSLANYKGRDVLLVFWTMGSPQSMKILPEIQKLSKMLGSDSAVISINLDGNDEKVSKFAKEQGVSFPILINPKSTFKTAMEYGLRDLPTVFVIDKSGFVKGKILGPKSAEALKSEVSKYGIH